MYMCIYIYVCVCVLAYVCVCVRVYVYGVYVCVCSIISLFIHYLHTIPFVSYSIDLIAVFNLVLDNSGLTQ